ncbi:MAG: aminoacyl-tRNA hydrolase [Candidatus Dependentiae bacterium]|nr:aminoacyl-tRNA hydrolase [Candidatus Dependentiae bacterium]
MNKQIALLADIKISIKAIVGLGNPGPTYAYTPHNIGFLILDKLCELHGGTWSEKNNMLIASVDINDKEILLVKPQTFMNNSGEILKHLQKRGIKQENIFAIHDEIDFVFGKVTIKQGGSARGHNGLRSLIAHGGENFLRLRCGVGRPNDPALVGNFVTAKFKETPDQVDGLIAKSVDMIQTILSEESFNSSL